MTGDPEQPPDGRLATHSSPTIWIEIDDLIDFFSRHDQPTGIQRVVLELLGAARRKALPCLRICRINRRSERLEAFDLGLIDTVIDWVRREGRVYQRYGRRHRRLGILARDIFRLTQRRHPGRRMTDSHHANEEAFAAAARPGDVILSMGNAWVNRRFAAVIESYKQRHGLRFVQLVYDIIPISHPDLIEPRTIPQFVAWLHETAQLADLYLVPSQHVAEDLRRYCAAQGWPTRPIRPIRLGSGLSAQQLTRQAPVRPIPPRPLVLCVTVIDPRKNVDFLISAWERLVARHGAARVPTLVLAGHRGYRSAQSLARLRDDGPTQGRVRYLERVPDATLTALYEAASFTVFPSKAEGWGLPVEESLMHGRPVFSSNATSLPEVGGDLAVYFDPDDIEDACARLERAILDPDYLAELAERIRREYRPRSWGETVDQIVGIIAQECAALDARHDGRGAAAAAG